MKRRKLFTNLRSWKVQACKLPGQVTCGPALRTPEHNSRPLRWEARVVGGRLVGQFARNARTGKGKGWLREVA